MKTRDYKRLNKKPKLVRKSNQPKRFINFNYAKHWEKLSKEEPNNQECQILGILTWLKLPYHYVGNAGLIVPGYIERGYTERCPDFVRSDGKKIIELFGERWHEIKDEPEKIAFFKQANYDTLVIWSKELSRKNRKKLYAKILQFDRR